MECASQALSTEQDRIILFKERLHIIYEIYFSLDDTLPETNIAPENRVSQKETSIPTIHFQVQTVSFRNDTQDKKAKY